MPECGWKGVAGGVVSCRTGLSVVLEWNGMGGWMGVSVHRVQQEKQKEEEGEERAYE